MAIHASGEYMKRDFKQAQWVRRSHVVVRRFGLLTRFLIWGGFIVLVFYGFLLHQYLSGDDWFAVGFGVFLAGMSYAFLLVLVSTRLRFRKQWRSPVIQGNHDIIIDDKGIRCKNEVFESHWRWTAFVGMADSDKMLVLMPTNIQMLMFPRRFFASDADWQAFRVEARRRAGKCRKCGYMLRGSTSETCPECGTPLAPQAVGHVSA